MKKQALIILSSILSLNFVGNIYSFKTNKSYQFEKNHQNISLKKTNVYNDFVPEDHVTVSNFGPKQAPNNKYQALKLDIFMKPLSYALFNEALRECPQANFIKYFVGEGKPYLDESWENVKKQLYYELGRASLLRDLPANTFKNDLISYLQTPLGFQMFYGVFLGIDLKNNTYVMPEGYNTEAAVKQFRINGAILQICFGQVYGHPGQWAVSTDHTIIFPYIPDVMWLKQYYRDKFLVQGQIKLLPPIMPIHLDRPPITEESVFLVERFIFNDLAMYFDVPSTTFQKPQIKIPGFEYSNKISYDRRKATPISINFYSLNNGLLYTTKLVNLYLTGPA